MSSLGSKSKQLLNKSAVITEDKFSEGQFEEQLDDLNKEYLDALEKRKNIWLNFEKTCYIYLYRGGGEPSDVIAAFDLDGTIIKPKGRNKIPKNATDWKFFSVWTKLKIKQAIGERGARFIIFTNQNGVGLNLVPLDEIQERIELVVKGLDIPCSAFVAVNKDNFRKPRTRMFHLLNRSFNRSIPINPEVSFYCGDAIGYPSHSDADIEFARLLDIPFITPDKFIRGVQPKLQISDSQVNNSGGEDKSTTVD